MHLHPAFTIDGRPVLGTYGRTDLQALALAHQAGMNLVFGDAELLDPASERGRFCLDHGIKVMYSLAGHLYGRPALADAVTPDQRDLPLLGPAPPPGPGVVKLDDETIAYAAATPGALLGCARGAEDTTPAAHRAGVTLFWPAPAAAEVARVQGSPNLYGYYVLDDSGGNMLSALRGLYAVAKRLDPTRPVCGGYSGTTTLHNFAADAADVLLIYHYPVLKTGYERAMTALETQWMMLEARRRAPGVPFFGVYQAFWGGQWNKQSPLGPAELREQLEDFVREGASGLISFYLSPEEGEFLGWNCDPEMQRVVMEANREIRETGGLQVPPEPPALAQVRFQPAGYHRDPVPVPGVIPAWHVLAPLPDTEGKRLDAVFPPERGVDLAASYPGRGRTLRWETLASVAGGIGLVETCGPEVHEGGCLAYGYCTVTSPVAQDIQLRFSSDDDAILWLNGRQVWRHDGPRGVHWDADVIPAHLPAGKSQVLVKVYNREGQSGFFLRLTDPAGRPLEGLQFSPTA